MFQLEKALKSLYPNDYKHAAEDIEKLIETHKTKQVAKLFVDEKDVMLITYGDSISKSGEKPLQTLNRFLDKYVHPHINSVHILPMFPYSSDDGFSVIDYEEIDPKLGDWQDIIQLSNRYDLMFDAVINHISMESEWFKKFQAQDETYKDYFIECFPERDYHKVIRPRALPLYYAYETVNGPKYIWATFSKDQVDLNYQNYHVLVRVLNILALYAKRGARYIRFDAVGFLWKDERTTSMHLEQTHIIVKIMRYVIEKMYPGTMIITETNVPHEENVSYFGHNDDEAHLVYQFPLPPLTLFSYLSQDASKLLAWADSLKHTNLGNKNTYFNFLASHDGIGMRPVENILTADEKQMMVNHTIERQGRIGYKNNADGSVSPYELNISYFDALSYTDEPESYRVMKFIGAHVILLSMMGMPAIYIHSLLGSQNDIEGMMASGINRRINRQKMDYDTLVSRLDDSDSIRHQVLHQMLRLIDMRKTLDAFHPNAEQVVRYLHKNVFSIVRKGKKDEVQVFVNVSDKTIQLDKIKGFNLLTEKQIETLELKPYEFAWIKS